MVRTESGIRCTCGAQSTLTVQHTLCACINKQASMLQPCVQTGCGWCTDMALCNPSLQAQCTLRSEGKASHLPADHLVNVREATLAELAFYGDEELPNLNGFAKQRAHTGSSCCASLTRLHDVCSPYTAVIPATAS